MRESLRSLADFYRGLAGRLESRELKGYIADSVKNMTGARQVELRLADELTDELTDEKSGAGQPNRDRLDYQLASEGHHLGEIYLYFEGSAEPNPADREIILEIMAAAAAALGAAAKYQKAVNLASLDGLTGLYNHRIFDEVFRREFAKAKRHQHGLALLSLDLDHFKVVNDSYGHQFGDLVLKSVADILTQVARATDLAARLGGEEFALLLPHTSQEQALVVATRVKSMLDHKYFDPGNGAVFHQTVSQGVAGVEHFMVKSPEDMLYLADQALYLAKREGRDAIRSVADVAPLKPAMKDGLYVFQ
ncbi:MAG: GGDEF domain-containing protein [Candidatus Adiutrix sp.]|jgi:diguanylate cyclase (GGDEF)-like protein|nr:GGDEF domain-containing protein [Candidatus Adiutrix sp.]